MGKLWTCLAVVILAACAKPAPVPQPQPQVQHYSAPSGDIDCEVPWLSAGLSVVENGGPGYESVAFVIESGSIHSAERYSIPQYPWMNPPKVVPPEKRLEHVEKVYLSQVWVPRFDLVESIASRQIRLAEGPVRLVLLNAEQNQRAQHYGLMLFSRADTQYILQYTHPLIWGEQMIFSALRDFYDKCTFK